MTLPRYRSSRFPKLDVVGLESERLLLLWLHNAESTWRTEYDSESPTPLKSLRHCAGGIRFMAGGVVGYLLRSGHPFRDGPVRERQAEPGRPGSEA